MEKARAATATPLQTGGAGKVKVPIMKRCFPCKAARRYIDSCTAKLCERWGERGHERCKSASPADMDESLAETVLAMMGDPGDDAVETTSFKGAAAKAPRWEYNRGHPRCA